MTPKPYTVVGIYWDSSEVVVDHIMALDAGDAMGLAESQRDDDSYDPELVFEGHLQDISPG